jgi:hypothetical protein
VVEEDRFVLRVVVQEVGRIVERLVRGLLVCFVVEYCVHVFHVERVLDVLALLADWHSLLQNRGGKLFRGRGVFGRGRLFLLLAD